MSKKWCHKIYYNQNTVNIFIQCAVCARRWFMTCSLNRSINYVCKRYNKVRHVTMDNFLFFVIICEYRLTLLTGHVIERFASVSGVKGMWEKIWSKRNVREIGMCKRMQCKKRWMRKKKKLERKIKCVRYRLSI